MTDEAGEQPLNDSKYEMYARHRATGASTKTAFLAAGYPPEALFQAYEIERKPGMLDRIAYLRKRV